MISGYYEAIQMLKADILLFSLSMIPISSFVNLKRNVKNYWIDWNVDLSVTFFFESISYEATKKSKIFEKEEERARLRRFFAQFCSVNFAKVVWDYIHHISFRFYVNWIPYWSYLKRTVRVFKTILLRNPAYSLIFVQEQKCGTQFGSKSLQ